LSDIESNGAAAKTSIIELQQVLDNHGIEIGSSEVKSYDFMAVSNMLTGDDIWFLKKVKSQGITVYAPKERFYTEMRGGTWELALMLVGEAARDIVLALAASWIYDKAKTWRETKKKKSDTDIKEPQVRMKLYLTKTKELIEIEGDADSAIRVLKKLRKKRKND
jgi:hypothetical protein